MQKEFNLRRRELLRRLGSDGMAIISAAKEAKVGGYPYLQDSDFYYLTGCLEPEAIMMLVQGRGEGEFVLFCHENDPVKEVWDGAAIDQEKALSEFGADQAFSLEEIDEILPQMLAGKDNIYFNLDFDQDFIQKIIFWRNQAKAKIKGWIEFPRKLSSLGSVLHDMRLKKSRSELANIRKAIAITTQGHLRAMQKCRPEMCEFELEAELLYEFNRLGGRQLSFEPIVAGGVNACTFHYPQKDSKLLAGELVLIDAGVRCGGYCADISRTFPVNGKFTPEQRAIYELVLTAQLEVIKQIRPGVAWGVLQAVAERVIAEGLVDLGLPQVPFAHKIGHWLGLDIHDVGGYQIEGKWRTLESGMVFTVEPGIYLRPDIADIDSKWLGIGVRIEDNILVTDSGCEVLSKSLPKSIVEIEGVMARKR